MDFFSFGLSEQQKKELQERYEKAEMFREEFRHAFQRLFEELNEDQLRTVHTMLRVLADAETPLIAAEWYGMSGWALKNRFNICVTCGINHDEEFDSNVPHTTVTKNFPSESKSESPQHSTLSDTSWTSEERELMEKYHLDDAYDEDTGKFLGFICTGIKGWDKPCGVRYPSIEDRMKREPESCSGCHQRMMHG